MKKFLRGPGFYLLLLLVIIFIVSTLGIRLLRGNLISELLEAIEANKVERIQTIETTVIGLYRVHILRKRFFIRWKI